jgi:hypothetical protein
MVTGILTQDNIASFILDESGDRHFEDRIIWDGYLAHWSGVKVHARELEQHDYKNNEPIIIIWPVETRSTEPFVELYYNERLTKYFVSFLGHTAVNVNGSIFNFSHLMNENEIMEKEEYFFRPALGEFAPSPNNGLFEILEDGRVFYDKFGRNFMRTIHRIRIFGLDTEKMMATLKQSLDIILNTPPNPKEPDKYKDFSIVSNNCATIIRDVFNQCGFPEIKGRFPRDLFVNTTYHLFCHPELDVQYAKLPQLFVPEAPMSMVSPLLNFRNYFRKNELRIFETS